MRARFFHLVSENWHSVREKYKNLWGLWVRAHAIIKNEGSLGDSDAEKGGLLSLTYASPPEWDCPPPPPEPIVTNAGRVVVGRAG